VLARLGSVTAISKSSVPEARSDCNIRHLYTPIARAGAGAARGQLHDWLVRVLAIGLVLPPD
jgi:hypothetical protein